MVQYQGPLGLQNCPFNSVELLGDIGAGLVAFDHGNEALMVAIGSLQPLYDLWMICVGVMVNHRQDLTPPGGGVASALFALPRSPLNRSRTWGRDESGRPGAATN
jgi:hypothetical protein